MTKIIKLWEKQEIVLTAKQQHKNPYKNVRVWAQLVGPNFDKRVYGFWDGDDTYRIRLTATAIGNWSYETHSNTDDTGLNGHRGEYTAEDWSSGEKAANPCRRGFIQPTENQHAFMYADGTPYIMLGDTWWSTPTFRFKWYDDDIKRDIGPDMGFKDMVQYRKAQGFNAIAMLAAFPTWTNDDGQPSTLVMDDGIAIRAAWQEDGSSSTDASGLYLKAKPMHNEGGRAFTFPGIVPGYENVVPDFDSINPDYFKHMDKKLDYLNSQGFIPFIEVSRRDISQVWDKYYNFTESYGRYIQYIYSRYQANSCLFSPIHFDYTGYAIPARQFNQPANWVVDNFGRPPFGTLQGSNSAPSSLCNFGHSDEANWLTFHQIGNSREHDFYWYLTDIYYDKEPRPAINGEPYYSGHPESMPERMGKDGKMYRPGLHEDGIEGGTKDDNMNCRSGFYGSFLSGGYGGVIYGAEGLWSGNIEPQTVYKTWDALQFSSSDELQYLRDFALVQGDKYTELMPNNDLLTPNKSGNAMGFRGWAYCSATQDRDFALMYFEKGCHQADIRAMQIETEYEFTWYNPRTGEWSEKQTIKSNVIGLMKLPNFPDEDDWGGMLLIKA